MYGLTIGKIPVAVISILLISTSTQRKPISSMSSSTTKRQKNRRLRKGSYQTHMTLGICCNINNLDKVFKKYFFVNKVNSNVMISAMESRAGKSCVEF